MVNFVGAEPLQDPTQPITSPSIPKLNMVGAESVAPPDISTDVKPLNVNMVGAEPIDSRINSTNKPLNILFAALEQLGRPGYAVQNALHDVLDGGDTNVLDSAVKGWNLEQKRTFSDNLTQLGWKDATGWAAVPKVVAGILGDVIMDPLNLVGGVGILNKAGKVGKAFEEAKQAGDIVRQGGKWIDKAGQEVFAGINEAGQVDRASSIYKTSVAANRAGQEGDVMRGVGIAGVPIVPIAIQNEITKGLAKAGVDLVDNVPVVSRINDFLAKNLSTKLRPSEIDPERWNEFIDLRTKSMNLRSSIEHGYMEQAKEIFDQLKTEGIAGTKMDDLLAQIESKGFVASRGGQKAINTMKDITEKFKSVDNGFHTFIDEVGYQYMPHVLEQMDTIAQSTLDNFSKLKDSLIWRDGMGWFNQMGQKVFDKVDKVGRFNPGDMKSDLGLGSKLFSTDSASFIRRSLMKLNDGTEDFIVSTKTGTVWKGGVKQDMKLSDGMIQKLEENGSAMVNGSPFSLSQAKVTDINAALGVQLFSTDIPKLIAIQGNRTAKLISSDDFFKKIAHMGIDTPYNAKGNALTRVDVPGLVGKYFEPEIAQHINETYKRLINPDEMNNLLKTFDSIQNMWKGTATYWNVAFHTRNMISNTWQNYLAGVTNPLVYKEARDIQSSIAHGIELTANQSKIWKEYIDQGLQKVGQMSGDIGKRLEDELMSWTDLIKRDGAGGIVNGFNRNMGRVGEQVEGWAKLSHFISKRADGLSPFDAGQSVKKYLFDYQDLAPMERDLIKRVIPFMTWSRKNIPMELDTFIHSPAKQAVVQHIKDNVEVYAGNDNMQKILPSWLKDASPIYVGEKDGKHRYVKLDALLPVTDLMKLGSGVQGMFEQISPVLKLLTELPMNKTFFMPGADITKQDLFASLVPGIGYGEKDYFSTQLPGRLEYMARMFRPLNELEKLVPGSRRYAGMTGVDRLVNFALGGKLYQYDEQDLRKQFKTQNEQQVRDIKAQLHKLNRITIDHPELMDQNQGMADNLRLLIRKSNEMKLKNLQDSRSDENGSTSSDASPPPERPVAPYFE